jgi:bis(5'-nucleosidyl)-tetraphosphatase
MVSKSQNPGKQTSKTTASRRPKGGSRLALEKSAGAIVFHRGEKLEFLLIFSTYWEFPKGLVEPDEQETEAAIREVREETGLIVKLLARFREEIEYFYRREGRLIRKQVVYFLGEARDQTVRVSGEHREAKWLSSDKALVELKYENARAMLRKANDFLNEGRLNEDSRN